MWGAHVLTMLPDFNRMRKQSGAEVDLRSIEHRSDKSFSEPKSFQQSDTKRDRKACQGHRDPSSDLDHQFFRLWIEQPSWSPILLTKKGWITVKGSSQKKVPLTLRTIESYYRRYIVIGKRFGKLTNYLMVDIDIHSPYHPDNGGFQSIVIALERIGLCRFLIVRSSTSGGLHLYFPLPTAVNAWRLAATAHSVLTAHGVTIAGGQCELFP